MILLFQEFIFWCCCLLWTGNYASIWYHQWTIIWKHKKLDTKHWRGKTYLHMVIDVFTSTRQ